MGEHPNLTGKWLLQRCENFENFLRENGIGERLRTKAAKLDSLQEIRQNGDHISVNVTHPMFKHAQSINVGKDHVDPTHGPTMQVSSRWEGQKLVLTLEPVNKQKYKTQTITRELLDNGQLLMTLEVGDVVAKRWYKKTDQGDAVQVDPAIELVGDGPWDD